MSGIAGIVNLDGAPVDRDLLARMTAFMSFRGPDAQEIRIDGNVGFGHTMLRTTFEAETEQQPLTLDGKVWLTADARIDGRTQLMSELEEKLDRKIRIPVSERQPFSNGHGQESRIPNDAELILLAYEAWGEECVKHLIGDFAFAIWDSRQRRVFCARDHFGVKPFYYAHVGNSFVFSNTLNCIRFHPQVSNGLNDLAVADFLIFGANQEAGTTVFAEVRRLQPAHALTLETNKLRLKVYWTLPDDGHVRYRRSYDYIEHFKEVLENAVGSRLRTNNVGVFMSGGLDSPSVAAVTKKVLSRQSASYDLRAYTTVYDKLIPDKERYYSGLVAESLGIPIQYLVADGYTLYERWDQHELRTPEPNDDPLFAAVNHDQYRQVAANSRVSFTGFGGDPALLASPSYVSAQLKGLHFIKLATESFGYVLLRRRIPPIGFRTVFRRCWRGKPQHWRPRYPRWIRSELGLQLGLQSRWEEISKEVVPCGHSVRPEAYQQYTPPFWANLFETMDPGVTLFPLESRHPFFDTRLINFLLSIPPVPWCLNKQMLRSAMRNVLPDEIRLRPKTPLAGNPLHESLRCSAKCLYDNFKPLPELGKYVESDQLPIFADQADPNQVWEVTRPYSLAYWLHWLRG